MCPFLYLSFFISFLMLLFDLTGAVLKIEKYSFSTNHIQLSEGETSTVTLKINDSNIDNRSNEAVIYSLILEPDTNLIDIKPKTFTIDSHDTEFLSLGLIKNITITGKRIGFVDIKLIKEYQIKNASNKPSVKNSINEMVHFDDDNNDGDESMKEKIINETLKVVIINKNTILTKIFLISVPTLVTLHYINMGCALDLQVVKMTIKKPIAPIIGLFSQYLFMPVMAYIIGLALLDQKYFRFALLAFGCSPGGSASNIWTLLLGGNLDLSLTMTFISTILALVMMPVWLFTLGASIFDNGKKTKIPYTNILGLLLGMGLALGVGLLVQRYLPKVAKVCRKILVPVSFVLIIYIVIFGIVAYHQIFRLFTWNIFGASSLMVWSGFVFGFILAKCFLLPNQDVIAIAIETGIQQTGVTVAVINFTLPHPESDLSLLIPVACSILTPFPLIIVWIYKKIKSCSSTKEAYEFDADSSGKIVDKSINEESYCQLIKGRLCGADRNRQGA